MESIELKNTLPQVFASRDSIESDVWHKEIALQKGKLYLLEANSGTGKSSFCSYIFGYRKDYQGIICFDGKNINSLTTSQWVDVRKNHISMLWQELRLFPELTAFDNVLIKNNLTGFQKKKQIDAKIGRMSFGQQQRVAMIRALCQPFDFIFADEPISHLDDRNSEIMASIMMAEAKRQGAGVIVTSIGKHMVLDYERVLKL